MNSNALCEVKKVRLKKLPALSFYLNNMLEKEKLGIEEWLPGAGVGWGNFLGLEMFCSSTVVVLTQLYVFFWIHKVVYQKGVHFTVCKLYLKTLTLKSGS